MPSSRAWSVPPIRMPDAAVMGRKARRAGRRPHLRRGATATVGRSSDGPLAGRWRLLNIENAFWVLDPRYGAAPFRSTRATGIQSRGRGARRFPGPCHSRAVFPAADSSHSRAEEQMERNGEKESGEAGAAEDQQDRDRQLHQRSSDDRGARSPLSSPRGQPAQVVVREEGPAAGDRIEPVAVQLVEDGPTVEEKEFESHREPRRRRARGGRWSRPGARTPTTGGTAARRRSGRTLDRAARRPSPPISPARRSLRRPRGTRRP